MKEPIEIRDWVDATRPMRGAVHDALARLRQAIANEPEERITQRSLMSPYLLEVEGRDELHTQIERALDAISLDEVGEVRPA